MHVNVSHAWILNYGLYANASYITDIIYYVEKPKKSAYQVENVTTNASTTTTTTPSPTTPLIMPAEPYDDWD